MLTWQLLHVQVKIAVFQHILQSVVKQHTCVYIYVHVCVSMCVCKCAYVHMYVCVFSVSSGLQSKGELPVH